MKSFQFLRSHDRLDRPYGRKNVFIAFSLGLLAILYMAAYIFTYSRYRADDAYIHLRIVKHFVEQGVPYYNPDEAVAGSSSLFWLVLLTSIFKIIGVKPAVLPLIEFLFTTGVFISGIWLLRQRFTLNLSIGMSFLAVILGLINVSVLLMETPAAIFFWQISIIFLIKKKFGWFGFFAGLTFLVRYEFAIWGVIGLLSCTNNSARYAYIKGILIPVAFFLLFHLYYFNTIIPNTVLAKAKIYSLSIDDFIFQMSLDRFRFSLFLATLLILFYNVSRCSEIWKKSIGYFCIILFILYFIPKTALFPWYLPNIYYVMMIALLVSLSHISWLTTILFLLAAQQLPTYAMKEAYGLVVGNYDVYRDSLANRRVDQYLKIADTIAQEYPAATLLTSEIGALGWGFPGKVADGAGLVSPEFLKYHPMAMPQDRTTPWGSIPPQAVRDLQPDFIISLPILSEAVRRDIGYGVLNYRVFRAYPVVELVEGEHPLLVWGDAFIYVYARQDIVDHLSSGSDDYPYVP